MLQILTRAGSFIAIIVLGYVLKRIGVFKEEDFGVLSKICIRITLPAAIITSFAGKEIDAGLLVLLFLGIGCGVLYILLGFLLNRKSSKEQRAFEILNLPGYNIGCFTMPFAQSFLGPMGVIATSLFDSGNAFICLGGAFGVASAVKDGRGFDFKRIFKALSRSVPFVTYLLMVAMHLLRLPVPGMVIECASIIGGANSFMAMFMIGVGFKLTLGDKSQTGQILKLLGIRYGVGTILALIFYFVLPFDIQVRQALVILAFSPIGSAVPPFTAELGGDVGLSSAINSMAIVISICIYVVLLSVML
ncbi:MAG: AEC family transporter [Oscillospiraceae bacterium]|nr:AEC family transporter [Oscillospiraceae bacterium]MBQ8354731.1 AEC family transporter [Oscillospiraceae bacterium]